MRTALVIGGADCLQDDLLKYAGPIDGVVACNCAGTIYPGDLTAWVSLHPENFYGRGRQWVATREANGHRRAWRLIGHKGHPSKHVPSDVEISNCVFPGQEQQGGSSGMFAVKVALADLGFDRAVLAGIPMTDAPHFNRRDRWKAHTGFRPQWLTIPAEYAERIKSVSGWTAEQFGMPREIEACTF